jgi:acetolactate synthase small subunit
MISRLDTQTNIRLPADLKRSLVDAAAENRRSLSAEIEARLAETFSGGAQAGDHEQMRRVVDQLMDTLKVERHQRADVLRHVLLMYNQTLRGFDEAILMAQHKNGRQEDLRRLREDFDQSRGALKAFDAMLRTISDESALKCMRRSAPNAIRASWTGSFGATGECSESNTSCTS